MFYIHERLESSQELQIYSRYKCNHKQEAIETEGRKGEISRTIIKLLHTFQG